MSRRTSVTAHFGPLLREYRELRGLSQMALATMMRRSRAPREGARYPTESLDHSTLSRLERGVRNPSHAMVTALADALELEDVERFRFFAAAGYLEKLPSELEIERMVDALDMWL